MSNALIGALKEVRVEAVEHFKAHNIDCPEVLVQSAAAAIDKAIGGALDVFEEHYTDVITGTASDGESSVDLSCQSGLSGLYFDEINS